MREQQEQTHSLIKGGSLKISQETLLFLFCSEVNKSVVSPEISEPNVFSIQLSKKYFSLIIKMHNYCRCKKVSHLPQIICFNMTILSSPTQPFTWNSYLFFCEKNPKGFIIKSCFFLYWKLKKKWTLAVSKDSAGFMMVNLRLCKDFLRTNI